MKSRPGEMGGLLERVVELSERPLPAGYQQTPSTPTQEAHPVAPTAGTTGTAGTRDPSPAARASRPTACLSCREHASILHFLRHCFTSLVRSLCPRPPCTQHIPFALHSLTGHPCPTPILPPAPSPSPPSMCARCAASQSFIIHIIGVAGGGGIGNVSPPEMETFFVEK